MGDRLEPHAVIARVPRPRRPPVLPAPLVRGGELLALDPGLVAIGWARFPIPASRSRALAAGVPTPLDVGTLHVPATGSLADRLAWILDVGAEDLMLSGHGRPGAVQVVIEAPERGGRYRRTRDGAVNARDLVRHHYAVGVLLAALAARRPAGGVELMPAGTSPKRQRAAVLTAWWPASVEVSAHCRDAVWLGYRVLADPLRWRASVTAAT